MTRNLPHGKLNNWVEPRVCDNLLWWGWGLDEVVGSCPGASVVPVWMTRYILRPMHITWQPEFHIYDNRFDLACLCPYTMRLR